jgi:hypothetical protein
MVPLGLFRDVVFGAANVLYALAYAALADVRSSSVRSRGDGPDA